MEYILCIYTCDQNYIFLAQIDAHSETLCNEQAAFVLTRGGLGTIYSICDKYKGTTDIKDLKNNIGMDADSVQSGKLDNNTLVIPYIIYIVYMTQIRSMTHIMNHIQQ